MKEKPTTKKVEIININCPTLAEFYNHLSNGGHIKYASDILLNDINNKSLTGKKGSVELFYSFGRDFTPNIKRFKFGTMVPLNFKMNLVELINLSDINLDDIEQKPSI